MASDPTKPLLRLSVRENGERSPGRPRRPKAPEPSTIRQQTRRFGPQFQRLGDILSRPNGALQLQADPSALAPERLLVFEVRGPVQNFMNAVRRVPGLELVDEGEVEIEHDEQPVLYLLIPDERALQEILSLWERWRAGTQLAHGYTPWRHVFSLLNALRPWGPGDRVAARESEVLFEEIEGRPDQDAIPLEIELVFRGNSERAMRAENVVRARVAEAGGQVASRSRIDDIAYHAILARIPVGSVREIAERSSGSLAGLDEIMYIRPQSLAATVSVEDASARPPREQAMPAGEPVLAMIDGVPVAAHPLLAGRLDVDDAFGLEPRTVVAQRFHGTAMSSLVIHGDRNGNEQPLPKRIHVVPVMTSDGHNEVFPDDQLIIDLIYQAIVRMKDGPDARAPNIVIVNMSLGNLRRPFQGNMSAWARLLDRLAWRYGILFVVSAGNVTLPFGADGFRNQNEFEGSDPVERGALVLAEVARLLPERRIIAPAETVNGLTIGASNVDAVPQTQRGGASLNVEAYPAVRISNPSSRLGPGFANAVKPDLILAGSREHLRFQGRAGGKSVRPAGATRAFGIKVASPPVGSNAAMEGYIGGTSAAAAIASRTCHRIYDALELNYQDEFRGLSSTQKAVVLKALLVHPARWPSDGARLIQDVVGPHDPHASAHRKDNVRRFLGYGTFDPADAIACASDRATFWVAGDLEADQSALVDVPIPVCMGGQARIHSVTATLAWFTPIHTGRRSYRVVRLNLLEPSQLGQLRVTAVSDQPDGNQIRRGTVLSRTWGGLDAPVIGANMNMRVIVQREPDQGPRVEDAVPFGLAITVTMPGLVELYDQVRLRLQPRVRTRGR